MHLSVPFRRFVASILFVAYATLAVVGGALVRCEEADGTVRIEWRGENCCVPRSPLGSASRAEAAASPAEDPECGGCRDEALADTVSARSARRSSAADERDVAPAPPALLVGAKPAFFEQVTRRPHRAREAFPPPPIAAIRTVVLRV